MKIVILSQTYPVNTHDGTAHFMYDLAEGFSKLDHQVTVVVPWHQKQKLKVKMFKYIWPDRWHLLGYGRTLENDQNLRWWAYALIPFYLIFATIKLWQIDAHVINAHWLIPNGIPAVIVGRLKKIPVIITLPGSDVYLANKNWLNRIISNLVLKSAAGVVSNSPQLLADVGFPGKIISYGVPINKSGGMRNVLLATAGRRVEKKGIEILQRLFPEIEVLSDLSIEEFRKKLTKVRIFIAWSIRDSRGNLDDASLTVLEAMAAGCTVLVPDLPGYKRIITSGFNGYLVKSEKDMDKAVRQAKDLGGAAQKTIRERFTPEKVAMAYLKCFGEAMTK